MIIWLNGAFGAGKTQTAYALSRMLPNSFVFDPEEAGFYIRANLPNPIRQPDFQDYPMWRNFNSDMLRYIAERYDGTVIVPMTVTDRMYFTELTAGLLGICPVRHFILMASSETVLKRLGKRMEGKTSWAAQQLPRCRIAFEMENWGEKIQTDYLTPEQTAAEVAKQCGLEMMPDRRSPLRRSLGRLAVQIRHIRG